MVVYSSTAVRASVNNNQTGGLSNNPDATLIEKNQNRFEFGPQTLSLELPDAGSVSVKNFPKLANVTFITGDKQLDFGNIEFADPYDQLCKDKGYTKTSCETGYWKSDFCPYKNEYFKQCCADKYKYTADSCSYPNELSSDGCGGKYRCICNRTLYPVESCASPQVVSGDACTEDGKKYYSECVCPSNYTETCTGQNQQGRGTGCTYNGTTKYTACECKPGYNQTCTELGPVTPSDYCQMNGVKYYNNCKTCENKCKLDSCPAGVSCTLEDCSGKYCDVGCATGYVNWCTKPETDCAKLGYTKSVSQCSDGYLQCPYNSAAVFCEEQAVETCNIANCTKCKAGNPNECETCANGYYGYPLTIVGQESHWTECKKLNAIEPSLCLVASCETCSADKKTCLKCQSGYELNSGKCYALVKDCVYGYLSNGDCCTKQDHDDCSWKGPNGEMKPCKCLGSAGAIQ
ncbi:MAG: hypothetical protein ACLT2E_06515 [Alphaproteobacteria bacterium]